MPRIRSIKPDFFLDDEITTLPYQIRLAFIGLWCHADRDGRLEDKPRHLKAVIFPYDEIDMESTLERLENYVKTEGQPFISRYDVNGRKYIQINNFSKHQRPHHTEQESKIPQNKPSKNRSLPVVPQEGKEAVLKEEGMVMGKGKEFILSRRKRKLSGSSLTLFNDFWKAFSDKRGKAEAADAWLDIDWPDDRDGSFISKILSSAEAYAAHRQDLINNGSTPKMAQGWLSGRRWEDEILAEEDLTARHERWRREREQKSTD